MKDLGQLFMTGVAGTELTEDEKDIIQDMDLGGVILFSRNYENPVQLARLINSIQELRNEQPMFIAVDQEGGRVMRFKEPFLQLPSAGHMASYESAKLVYNAYRTQARELKAVGVNLNFSPCVDILKNKDNEVIGDRAFGDNAEVVERFMSAALRGVQTERLIPCVKHFPGHGRTAEDSHEELPRLSGVYDEMRNEEFKVFKKAVRSKLDFVMVAHLLVDEIDSELPTSLAPKTYKILRDEMKFSRIAITDDMQMKAITDNYGLGDAAEMAINAGADIVLYRDLETGYKAFKEVEKKVASRDIPPQVVRSKVQRIFKCKEARLKFYKPINAVTVSSSFGGKYANQVLESFTGEKKVRPPREDRPERHQEPEKTENTDKVNEPTKKVAKKVGKKTTKKVTKKTAKKVVKKVSKEE